MQPHLCSSSAIFSTRPWLYCTSSENKNANALRLTCTQNPNNSTFQDSLCPQDLCDIILPHFNTSQKKWTLGEMSQHNLIRRNYDVPLQPRKEHDTRTNCFEAHIDPTGTVYTTLTRRLLPSDTFMSTLRCPVLTRVQKCAQVKYLDSRSSKSDVNISITIFWLINRWLIDRL